MKLVVDNITIFPGEEDESLAEKIREHCGVDILGYAILRKSLDARNKNRIVYRFRVVIDIEEAAAHFLLGRPDVTTYSERPMISIRTRMTGEVVHIAGSGPAGLFCALRLIEEGARVELYERGSKVEERLKDIVQLESEGMLNESSNVLFGEGGAGAYSDGKLTTRTRRPEIDWFYNKLVEMGAPSSILHEAKPHLGTDRLRGIVTNIRKRILDAGSTVNFTESIDDIIVRNGAIEGAITSRGREVAMSRLVLATGHSARDTYAMLRKRGVVMEAKGFAAGVRIEHPADLIDDIQYGDSPYRDHLPTADYFLTSRGTGSGRGVYSFCMCPGGRVINSSSEQGRLCTNGMSFSDRNDPFSNSALVVTVSPEDCGDDLFGGIAFQRMIEEATYRGGGGGFIAPVQRVTSFLRGIFDQDLPPASYRPGVCAAGLHMLLPQWIVDELRAGLRHFDKTMKGFITESALIIGSETRTSSPVRVLRNAGFHSYSHHGLYPVGEGAGYAGGIVSSAVDGIRCADMIVAET